MQSDRNNRVGAQMKPARVLSVAVLIGLMGLGGAQAQSSLRTEVPANFPPSSYKGTQFVDNRGCVYVRAGIDGNVTWVPRMTRARQHICNAQPTFANAPATAPAATQTAAAQAPVVLPPPADMPQARASQPKPKPAARPAASAPRVKTPAPVRVAAPKPAPVRIVPAPAPVAMRPAPQPVRQVAVPARKTVTSRAPVARSGSEGCRWASPQSAQYLRGKGVRCGPQQARPAPAGVTVPAGMRGVYVAPQRRVAGGNSVAITPNTRIAPLHVAKMQAQAAGVGRVPPGYRRVWEDDRLNPKRAHQTLAGKRQMDLRWTRTVPRRLIDVSSGMDVTAFNPDLVFPYTSAEQQRMGRRGVMSTKGKAAAAANAATLSTRSAPKAPRAASDKALRVAVGHRYVQVGRYPSDKAAMADAAKLKRAGLSVRMGTLHGHDGGAARVLLAGPYGTPQALGNALYAARRAGFGGAFTRK